MLEELDTRWKKQFQESLKSSWNIEAWQAPTKDALLEKLQESVIKWTVF